MNDLVVEEGVVLPASELSVSFSRSGGPGGQHVNTTETRVQLRFNLEATGALHPAVKRRIRERFPSLVTQDGDVLISADRFRSRLQNLEDAQQRLVDIVQGCLRPPKPRKATRPTKASKERRIQQKRRDSNIKNSRGKVRDD